MVWESPQVPCGPIQTCPFPVPSGEDVGPRGSSVFPVYRPVAPGGNAPPAFGEAPSSRDTTLRPRRPKEARPRCTQKETPHNARRADKRNAGKRRPAAETAEKGRNAQLPPSMLPITQPTVGARYESPPDRRNQLKAGDAWGAKYRASCQGRSFRSTWRNLSSWLERPTEEISSHVFPIRRVRSR